MLRWLKRAGALLLALYLVAGLVLYLMQDQLIYFPTATAAQTWPQETWVANDGQRIQLWVVKGRNPDKAIIYFGGNNEDVTRNANDFARELPDYTIYLVVYRGYGKSTGKPGERAFKSDALAVFDAVAGRHDSLFIMGRSLGTGVASYLAAQGESRGLILVTPYDSLLAVAQRQYPFFPLSVLMGDTYRTDQLAATLTLPTLLMVAGDDQVVPPEHAYRLAGLLPAATHKVITIPTARHNKISHFPAYWEALRVFLNGLS